MPKFKADVNVGGDGGKASSSPEPDGPAAGAAREPDLTTTVATIGAIGVAAAVFDVALIPGMLIGVAAAYAPKYLPQVGERLEPVFNAAVRGAYKMTRRARNVVAEAQERMHDIAAEVEAEEAEATG